MEIRLINVLHFVSLFFTTHGRSLETILALKESDLQNFKAIQVDVLHIIEKRDDKTAIAVDSLDDLKTSASINSYDAAQYLQSSFNNGDNLFENIPAEGALDDVKKLGEEYASNLGNLNDDVSQNLNRVGDEASRNIEKIGEEVNKQVERYGEEAMENFNKIQQEAGETLNELGKNFEGTANDLSNFANKRGQETIDDSNNYSKDNSNNNTNTTKCSSR